MRALWIDSGNDPDWVKIANHGFTHLYFDLFDPRITRAYLDAVQAKGYGQGLYMVTNWPQFAGKTGAEIAKIVSERITACAYTNTRMQFDIEEHDPDLVLAILREWRRLRPNHNTSWTMESFQGGWMSPAFVTEIVNVLRVRVVPQYYTGSMDRIAHDMGLKNMLKAGFPMNMVTGFYDAADLPLSGWDGFAFTMGRLR